MAKKRKARATQPAAAEQPPPTEQQEIHEQQQELEPPGGMELEQTPDEQEPEEEDPQEDEEQEEEEEEEESDEEADVKVEANGEQTEDLDDEPLEKLLEPFSKEQLVLLLKEAVSKHPEFIESVQKIADADPAHRKIFVHGLGWDTTSEVLISEFGKYGEIEDCKHVVDKVSGKSKGYAFLLFKHRAGAQKALKDPQKKIGNRITSCQLASAGPVPAPPPNAPPVSELTQRKIFVSNVAADIDPQKLLEFFSKFGEIDDGPLGLDKQTGKPRGFALFVYKSLEGAKKALEEPHKIFEGHTLHCQKAVDGPKPSKPFFQHQQYGGGGGGGHHHPAKKSKYSGSGGGGGHGSHGHLMAPSGPSVGYNPGVPPLNPALGQALTALLATQGGGLGNLLGLGGAPQGMPPAGYGNQAGASYGAQPGMQGGYPNQQGGQGGNRQQQGGGPYGH
ncbi:putative RNA recognition motif domain, nucleotide-binding alpha-beta plait domain superfamily [Helianthus annuus]|nr:putative RNA recognition motif domain, nucleotide-binding alpha-beta plait domain superfamily [Helianthus annuus]